jgi:hypothetical protein
MDPVGHSQDPGFCQAITAIFRISKLGKTSQNGKKNRLCAVGSVPAAPHQTRKHMREISISR